MAEGLLTYRKLNLKDITFESSGIPAKGTSFFSVDFFFFLVNLRLSREKSLNDTPMGLNSWHVAQNGYLNVFLVPFRYQGNTFVYARKQLQT